MPVVPRSSSDALAGPPPRQPVHHVQLLKGSQAFFPALIAEIDAASLEVRLETYIFDLTAGGAQVALALERAALRGVTTEVLVDGIGSPPLPPEWSQRLMQAGVRWCVFAPMGTLGMLRPGQWRRLHRKLVCIDQRVAFCGGINILDDFHDPNHGHLHNPRFDFSVRIAGPLVMEVHAAMVQLWRQTDRNRSLKSGNLRLALGAVVAASRDAGTALLGAVIQPREPPVLAALVSKAALVLRDNVLHRTGIERAYRRAIGQAQHEIIIANAYFVPGRKLRLALIHAAHRGVRVRLLLQGHYEYFMQYYAARPVYGALLKAGVEIHEYSASFLHAKVAVVDGEWATVGSSNLDPLSLLLAREANITTQGKAFATELRAQLIHAMEQDGAPMDPAEYAQRPLRKRCLEYIAYMAMRVALLLQGRKYL